MRWVLMSILSVLLCALGCQGAGVRKLEPDYGRTLKTPEPTELLVVGGSLQRGELTPEQVCIGHSQSHDKARAWYERVLNIAGGRVFELRVNESGRTVVQFVQEPTGQWRAHLWRDWRVPDGPIDLGLYREPCPIVGTRWMFVFDGNAPEVVDLTSLRRTPVPGLLPHGICVNASGVGLGRAPLEDVVVRFDLSQESPHAIPLPLPPIDSERDSGPLWSLGLAHERWAIISTSDRRIHAVALDGTPIGTLSGTMYVLSSKGIGVLSSRGQRRWFKVDVHGGLHDIGVFDPGVPRSFSPSGRWLLVDDGSYWTRMNVVHSPDRDSANCEWPQVPPLARQSLPWPVWLVD